MIDLLSATQGTNLDSGVVTSLSKAEPPNVQRMKKEILQLKKGLSVQGIVPMLSVE